jgi:Spy/CpxP family protein refolding chaperone
MSSSILSQHSSTLQRAVRSLGLPVLLMGALAGSLAGQSGPGTSTDPGPQPGRNSWDENKGPRHRMGGMAVVEGPASPEVLRDTVQLSGDKLQQYTKRYDAYMASTKSARDSLRTNLQAVRSAFQSGDRAAARDQRNLVKHQAQDLSKRDQQFEKDLNSLLTKDQQKRYSKWKDDREKSERSRWRGEHSHRERPESAPEQR